MKITLTQEDGTTVDFTPATMAQDTPADIPPVPEVPTDVPPTE